MNDLVAADVSPLTLFPIELEPTHVGCYETRI
jgi:hypothetical protein